MADIVFQVDNLMVEVFPDREVMGRAPARWVAERMRERIRHKGHVSIVFASAPSQDDFLAALAKEPGLDWQRVVAFQMDEYIGLPEDAPQSFGRYLQHRLFDRVKPGAVYLLNGNGPDLEAEMRRYSSLLRQFPPDITCAGIGENGHLAFNDPPLVELSKDILIREVRLTEQSRQQQVHDGCFERLEQVPERALTLTVPTLLSSQFVSCVVPGQRKAEAVWRVLRGSVGPECPASFLRRHPRGILFLDRESASLVMGQKP